VDVVTQQVSQSARADGRGPVQDNGIVINAVAESGGRIQDFHDSAHGVGSRGFSTAVKRCYIVDIDAVSEVWIAVVKVRSIANQTAIPIDIVALEGSRLSGRGGPAETDVVANDGVTQCRRSVKHFHHSSYRVGGQSVSAVVSGDHAVGIETVGQIEIVIAGSVDQRDLVAVANHLVAQQSSQST